MSEGRRSVILAVGRIAVIYNDRKRYITLSHPTVMKKARPRRAAYINRYYDLRLPGIENRKFAVVINATSFARALRTRTELGYIRRKGVPWFQVMCGSTERKCDEPPILSNKPEVIVNEILEGLGYRAGNGIPSYFAFQQ
jgi:hypothetical protein